MFQNVEPSKTEVNPPKKEKKLEEEEEIEEDDVKYKHRKDHLNKMEESQNEQKKEEKEEPILSFKERWKFRRPEAKKTLGKLIKEETSSVFNKNA